MKKAYSLDTIKKNSIPIAKEYGVARLYVFGSYARGEATGSSDIDLLIDKGSMRNLLQYFGFVAALEDVFKVHVDVVTTTSSDRDFLNRIKKEAILIYEPEGQTSSAEDKAILQRC